MKTELHAKFRDKNNIFPYFLMNFTFNGETCACFWCISKICAYLCNIPKINHETIKEEGGGGEGNPNVASFSHKYH